MKKQPILMWLISNRSAPGRQPLVRLSLWPPSLWTFLRSLLTYEGQKNLVEGLTNHYMKNSGKNRCELGYDQVPQIGVKINIFETTS